MLLLVNYLLIFLFVVHMSNFSVEVFDEDYICGTNAIAKIIYNYPYVGSEYTTPHYSRYTMLIESYKQNTALIPVDKNVYDRIAINTLY